MADQTAIAMDINEDQQKYNEKKNNTQEINGITMELELDGRSSVFFFNDDNIPTDDH